MKKIILYMLLGLIPLAMSAQTAEIKVQIDGRVKYQTMDGFGVNINTAWWYNDEYGDARILQPAIDLLVDSLGARVFRAVIEEIDWETINDDNDPNHFNWDYYGNIFSNARFQGVWNTLRYLNQKGITNNLLISFMGAPPASAPTDPYDPQKSWMGDIDFSIHPEMEDELVESIAALLYYARNIEKINFSLVSPMNETDIVASTKKPEHPDGIVEGPNMPDAEQFVRVIRKLAEKLDKIGMDDIRFVTPDAAGEKLFKACFDEMIKDPYLMGKMACWGVHQYGKDACNYLSIIRKHENPIKTYWVTETAGIKNLLGQLDDSATVHLFWDGFDCVYQHAVRNGYGSNPPNDWVFWEGEQGKPLLALNMSDQTWTPRKQFYEFSQLFRFVKPGALRVGSSANNNELTVYAYLNPGGQLVIFGRNNSSDSILINSTINGLSPLKGLSLYITNSQVNLQKKKDVVLSNNLLSVAIPAGTIFTMISFPEDRRTVISGNRPEPPGWYSGDMHVHRNCGEVTPTWSETSLVEMMETNDLSLISLLADMGNGEVKDSKSDLPKVTGLDSKQSTSSRILHWDAEWHFDPAGVTFEKKALGGHLVLLGLKKAHQIWDESPYKIIEWGKRQNAIVGFCHMQYLNDSIYSNIDCCTPVDYPVEAALGTIDFLAEDVWLNDAAINAYYRLLNCGFRLGWAAGTDYPCNDSRPLGSLLTYVQVKDQPLTYQKWIDGIKKGRTVVSLNGHNEFLNLKVGENYSPGDEIKTNKSITLDIEVQWTSILEQSGRIELVCNGKVIACKDCKASPEETPILKISQTFTKSSWICARRMDSKGHQSHTAPVYITVKNAPIRASAEDAQYFVRWIDNILENIKPGGPWNNYFTHDLEAVQKRYHKARDIYEKISKEAGKTIQ
jgi:O-glycosyl hydrolase